MRRVLVVGLDPHRVPGPWDPEPVATAVGAGMAELESAGYDAQPCWVGLGGGLRSDVELFESLVNLVRVHAPEARLAFNTSPDALFEAVRRQLPPG